MGVDYNIRPVKKKPNGDIEPVFIKDLPSLSSRYYQYQPLFRDNLEKIEKIANQKLDLDFYEIVDVSLYSDEPNKDIIFDPKKVKSTIKTILKVIKENPNKFPYFYWISFKGEKFMHGSEEVFIGDNKVYIEGGWDECYYILNDKKVDLTKEKFEFSAYSVLHEKINDKWIDKKGEKVIVVIKKYSFYKDFKATLNKIIVICDYAIKHNYY